MDWRCLFILLCSIASFGVNAGNGLLVQSFMDGLNESALSLAPSPFEPSEEMVTRNLSDQSGCVTSCFTMHDHELFTDKFNFSSNLILSEFKSYCMNFSRSYPLIRICLQNCPKSTLSALWSELFLMEYQLCQEAGTNYQGFINDIACYQREMETVQTKCKIRCDNTTNFSVGNKLDFNFRVKSAPLEISVTYPYNRNKTKNTGNLRQICSWNDCFNKCNQPIIKEKCGSENRMVDFARRMQFLLLNSLLSILRDEQAIEGDIAECWIEPNSTQVANHFRFPVSNPIGMVTPIVVVIAIAVSLAFCNRRRFYRVAEINTAPSRTFGGARNCRDYNLLV